MQPKVTFYQLNSEHTTDSQQLICDICFDYYSQNKRNIYILCPSIDYLYNLDEYIVNYQKKAFFPYQILAEGPIPPAPICLGTDTTTKLKYDILLNLHSIIPSNCNKYREIIELVPQDEQDRLISREHYKHYKKLAFNITFENEHRFSQNLQSC